METRRKTDKAICWLLMSVSVIATMVACSQKEDPVPDKSDTKPVEVSGVALNKTSASLAIGESVDLSASVSPSNASNKSVSWSSSDAGVATVSNGKVTAVKVGTATITVKAGDKTATCTITVVKGGFPEGKLPPNNEIWYITSDNRPLNNVSNQGSNVLQSNNYSGGMGVLQFSGPITIFDILSISSEECRRVTGILVPDCVEIIGNGAFYYEYKIKEFRVPASLKRVDGGFNSPLGTSLEKFTGNHVSQDGRCIIIDGNVLGFAPAGIDAYEIPSGVVSVQPGAFAYIKNVKSIVIPSGVKELTMFSFESSDFEEVTIPSSVTALHPYAFIYCNKLTKLNGDSPFISSDRKYLYDPDAYYPMTLYFFAGKNDTSYEIPEGIMAIENYAFSGCNNLKSITFPKSLEKISGLAFEGCQNLATLKGSHVTSDQKGFVNGAGSLQFLVPAIDDDYVVPDEVTAIGDHLFEGRTNLKSVTMGDKVTAIGDYAFQLCLSLKTVTLSANLVSMGYNPFMYDTGLEAVYFRGIIPPSYTDYQFTEAPALKFYVPSQALRLYTSNSGWKDYWKIMEPYDYTDLPKPTFYLSSDYSKEGEVTVYQKAKEGNGIDLVFMGDAYSDRQVASGKYLEDMKACVEEYFKIEPYKSFRDLFNIYIVTTVSSTEGYERGGQSLGTVLGLGTVISGNNSKCYELALKAIKDEKRMDEVLVIVCGNQDLSGGIVRLCGTCYMDDPVDWAGRDYSSGPCVAYFLKVDESFNETGEVLRHEAGGHGFVKLGDEYNYSGSIQPIDIDRITTREPYGWYANISLTSDPDKIKWSSFLSDERYKYDGVGIFEGAFTYQYSVWRPSENSIMKDNGKTFNAPSRYAIWYRIHKLAYGKDWKGTYEDFVTYDAKNRKSTKSDVSARWLPYKTTTAVQQHTAPVVTGRTWREAGRQ
jgi:hypothetical protein